MKEFLCVGINKFQLPGNDLAGCVADAQAMGQIAGLLGVSKVTTLCDSQATKARIWMALAGLVIKAKAGELSYLGFSYSAHGTHYPRPEEPDGLGEALVCHDTDSIEDDWDEHTIIKDVELRDLLNSVPKSCTVEVWLDTCYSGGIDRAVTGRNRFIHNPGNVAKVLRVSTGTAMAGLNSNIVMWQACSEAQTSADAFLGGGPHGAFTWFWTKAYKKSPKASRVELLLATRNGLNRSLYEQFPRLKCWNKPAQMMVGA